MYQIGERNNELIDLIKKKYGTQSMFAKQVESSIYRVSRIVNNKESMTVGEYRTWANALKITQIKLKDIING